MATIKGHLNGTQFDEANLVAYWKLENVSDSGPNGYTLTNTGPIPFISGAFANCASCVSTSAYSLKVNSSLGLAASTTTISFWVYMTAEKSNNFIITTFDSVHMAGFRFYGTTGGNIVLTRWLVGGSVSNLNYTSSTLINRWINLILTYDTVNIRGYANGSYLGLLAASGDGSSNQGDWFWIGADRDIAGRYFDGKIDEILVFNRVWSAQEIYNYYTQNRAMFSAYQW